MRPVCWGLVLGMLVAASAQAAPVTALVGGTLVDGTLREPIRDSVVLIEGERITAVGTVDTLPVPQGATVISTEGMTVLPGLWDMHVHLMINGHADYDHWDRTYPARLRDTIMPASALQLLHAGVTGARDLGGPLEDSIAVRDAINAGKIPGPTLFVSGPSSRRSCTRAPSSSAGAWSHPATRAPRCVVLPPRAWTW